MRKGKKHNGNTESSAFAQGVAFGHCSTWLEAFAERAGLPFALLAGRVGTLLLGATNGAMVGIENNVPTVRRKTAEGSTPVEQVAVVSGTPSQAQVKRGKDTYLGKQRTVQCPTCGVGIDEYCRVLSTGVKLSTCCHSARIALAGLKKRKYPKK